MAVTDTSGAVTDINTYDEYGNGPSTNRGRFQFAGKPYETMSELYDSRARMYNPRLGRFMQPDPIGDGDGVNMYAYAHGDPVNGRDPSGTNSGPLTAEQLAALVEQEAERWKNYNPGPNTGSNEMAAHSAALAERVFTSSVYVDVNGYFIKAKPGSCQDDPTCSAADTKWVPGPQFRLASSLRRRHRRLQIRGSRCQKAILRATGKGHVRRIRAWPELWPVQQLTWHLKRVS